MSVAYPIKTTHAASDMIPMNDALIELLTRDKLTDRPVHEVLVEYQQRAAAQMKHDDAKMDPVDRTSDFVDDDDEDEDEDVSSVAPSVDSEADTAAMPSSHMANHQHRRDSQCIYWVDIIGHAVHLMCSYDTIDVRARVDEELVGDENIDLDKVMLIAMQQFKAIKEIVKQQVL
jgi:hypothetical protein